MTGVVKLITKGLSCLKKSVMVNLVSFEALFCKSLVPDSSFDRIELSGDFKAGNPLRTEPSLIFNNTFCRVYPLRILCLSIWKVER